MTELLCPACEQPKASTSALCRTCLRALPWMYRARIDADARNLAKHPKEAGARARYKAAVADAVRVLKGEPAPPPAA